MPGETVDSPSPLELQEYVTDMLVQLAALAKQYNPDLAARIGSLIQPYAADGKEG